MHHLANNDVIIRMKLGFLNFACRLARAYVIDYLCVQGHVDLLFFLEND